MHFTKPFDIDELRVAVNRKIKETSVANF